MNDFTLEDLSPIESVVGKEPNWLLRTGTSLLVLIVICALVIAHFTRFPDSISVPILFTTKVPPVEIKAKSPGKLAKLFVLDGATVKAGQPLVLLESTVDFDQVVNLEKKLSELTMEFSLSDELFRLNNLGQLQSSFNHWLLHATRLQQHIDNPGWLKKVTSLEQTKQQYIDLAKDLENQQSTLRQRLFLQNSQYESKKALLKQGVIDTQSLNEEKQAILAGSIMLDEANIEIKRNKMTIQNMQHQINELHNDRTQEYQRLSTNLQQQNLLLQSEISVWKNNFLLTSPVDGVISASRYWSDNQYAEVDVPIMLILTDNRELLGKLYLPVAGSAEVKVGQKVKISIDNYPEHKFGSLIGQILSVSSLPHKEGYPVEVTLPPGLMSTYNKHLNLMPQTTGIAEIITRDYSLLERLFDQVFVSNGR